LGMAVAVTPAGTFALRSTYPPVAWALACGCVCLHGAMAVVVLCQDFQSTLPVGFLFSVRCLMYACGLATPHSLQLGAAVGASCGCNTQEVRSLQQPLQCRGRG
jgi:hypothetical protein